MENGITQLSQTKLNVYFIVSHTLERLRERRMKAVAHVPLAPVAAPSSVYAAHAIPTVLWILRQSIRLRQSWAFRFNR
jgi:hypothetical protein